MPSTQISNDSSVEDQLIDKAGDVDLMKSSHPPIRDSGLEKEKDVIDKVNWVNIRR